ncbi:MAG: hypothetical protein IPI38_13760 [Gemmatimonadetes bacterium]|nr:hypothetical protein [Gemmatimonadota bacterium]
MSRSLSRVMVVVCLCACSHPDAFPSGDPGDDGPFSGPPPQRLTLNPAVDQAPSWYPDGSALLYAFDQAERPDLDRCLGLLPALGGTRQAEKCPMVDAGGDSTDVYEWAAASAGGRVAWVEQHGPAGFRTPSSGAIAVGSLDPVASLRVLRALPYLAPSGAIHATATHLGWLGEDTVVYVGADVVTSRACQGCKLDTLVIGHDVVTLDLATDPATLAIVPGTAGATSVWPGSGSILYTLGGDSQVFRRQLATGVVDTVFDFGGLGIARDAGLIGSQLTAVVGGRVSFGIDPLLGPVQRDSGGTLYLVDLTSPTPTALSPDNQLLRHAAPVAGRGVVAAEATDTAGPFIPDLFLYTLP